MGLLDFLKTAPDQNGPLDLMSDDEKVKQIRKIINDSTDQARQQFIFSLGLPSGSGWGSSKW